MTTLSLTLLIGFATLAPIVFGAIIFALGAAGRATRRLVLVLSILGCAVPALAMVFLVPEVSFGDPIAVRPFGLGAGFGAWLIPTFRIDALAVYAGFGLAFLVLPLLAWLALVRLDTPESTAAELQDESDDHLSEDLNPSAQESNELTSDPEAGDASPELAEHDLREIIAKANTFAPTKVVRGLALSLALGTFALIAVFADGLVLLGVAWIAVAVGAWALGEVGSAWDDLDRPGLLATLVGPILWLVTMVVAAAAVNATRLVDLGGRKALTSFECVVLAVVFALAGGAYPAIAWVRRRAGLATPAGIAALALVVLPGTLYVAARTYAVSADAANSWPVIGASSPSGSPPPITAGLAFVVLGTVTVVIAGLSALGRRDARALIALLAVSQIGWGLVGLGAGRPASVTGVVVLVSSMVLGLGAMIASVVAGEAVSSDVEPEADGPRPLGASFRPYTLTSWCLGAGSLLGVPLLAGFAPRQLIAVGTVQGSGLNVPLGALCWAGDALLALAILRATAPALVGEFSARLERGRALTAPQWTDLPAMVFAALATLFGIFPGLVIGLFSGVATQSLLAPGSVQAVMTTSALGYSAGPAQWLAGIACLAVLATVAIVVIMRPGVESTNVPVYRSGRMDVSDEATATDELEEESSENRLVDPAVAWNDLASTFDTPWTMPGGRWLLAGLDGDDDVDEFEEGDDDDESASSHESTSGKDGVTVSAHGEGVPHGDE